MRTALGSYSRPMPEIVIRSQREVGGPLQVSVILVEMTDAHDPASEVLIPSYSSVRDSQRQSGGSRRQPRDSQRQPGECLATVPCRCR